MVGLVLGSVSLLHNTTNFRFHDVVKRWGHLLPYSLQSNEFGLQVEEERVSFWLSGRVGLMAFAESLRMCMHQNPMVGVDGGLLHGRVVPAKASCSTWL